jgi:8-oxo-dGTP diphosphatase
VIDVAVAVIFGRDGRILVGRRSRAADHLPDLHEFPGGKVDAGESAAEACARECLEELGAAVVVHGLLLPPVTHAYPGRTVRLHFFRCTIAPGSPDPQAVGTTEVRWIEPAALPQLAWPEANRPVLALLAPPSPRG